MVSRLLLMVWIAAAATLFSYTEAFSQSPSPKLLKKLLASPKETVRLKAVAAIDSMPRLKYEQLETIIDGVSTNFDRIGDTETPTPSMVALMYMIGSTQREPAIDFLNGLLSSDNPEVLTLVVDVLGGIKTPSAVEPISALIDHPAYDQLYALRFGISRALWSIRTPESLDSLATIYRRTDGQLSADLDRMFSEVDQSDFSGDEERYLNWRSSWSRGDIAPVGLTRKNSSPPDVGQPSSNDQEPTQPNLPQSELRIGDLTDGGSVQTPRLNFVEPQYYGIPIKAKRLLFVLDHSGSMRETTGADGETRLSRAKSELIYAIQSLPPDHEFAVMIFSNQMRLWHKSLEVANRENKVEAIQFVRGIGYGDRTNTYGALSLSLAFDPSLEAVYLLSDGRPTLGSIINTDSIVADITYRNRFRYLRFHTIGVSVAGETKQFLETLAARSDAEFRAVN